MMKMTEYFLKEYCSKSCKHYESCVGNNIEVESTCFVDDSNVVLLDTTREKEDIPIEMVYRVFCEYYSDSIFLFIKSANKFMVMR